MSEIKSSWEITQDRLKNIGDLTADERKEQEKSRINALGKGVAGKYMLTGNPAILDEELRKNKSGERERIKKAALQHLVDSIDIHNSIVPHPFSQGITQLGDSLSTSSRLQKIHTCIDAYHKLEKAEMRKIDSDARLILTQRAIAGTAIGKFNVHSRKEWEQTFITLATRYEEKLEKLKKEIT